MTRISYDILLSVQLQHDYYGGPCPDVALVPTPDCVAAMNDCGLLFRATADGVVLLFGTNERNQVIRKITSLTRFRFLLQLRNPAFLNVTKLIYPTLSLGKPYYCASNVADNGIIDNTTVLAKSTGKVGDREYGSLVGAALTIPLGPTVTQVSLTQVVPKAGRKTIVTIPVAGRDSLKLDLSALEIAPKQSISLSSGRYALELAGPAPSVFPIYYEASPMPVSLGIIELYKDETTNYAAKTSYTLTFRADTWKYYLIDSASQVTINAAGTDLANLSASTTGLGGLTLGWVKETEIEADTFEQRQYALLKNRNAGKPIFLLRSNRGMTQTAESAVTVKLTLAGVETILPTPRGNRSTLDVIQTL